MGALGISDDEAKRRQAQTGVSTGGTGYQSGMAPPPGSQPTGYAAPTGGPKDYSQNPALAPFTDAQRGTNPNRGWGVPNGANDTTTRTSNLTLGQVAPSTGQSGQTGYNPSRGGGTNYGSTATQGASPASGVNTQGYNPGGPVVGGVLGKVPYLGELTSTATTNLAPTQQAQAAAMGLSGNLENERFNYRPGEAPAQDRVQLDTAQADQTRARQQASLDALTGAANGTVPSAAELQMEEQAGRNNAATLGMARALGGRSAGGSARAATLAQGEANANTTVAGAAQRAAEQANARNALSSALQGVRGQDIDTSQANANLGQAANANNLQAQTQANQLAEQHRQELLKAQLEALGIGQKAAGDTVQASQANTNAINKTKGTYQDLIMSAL